MLPLPSWFLVLLSALGAGLNAPGFHTHLIGCIAYVPLFIVIDRIQTSGLGRFQRFKRIFFACYVTGAGMALIGTHWMIHAIHVFGHMPWIVSAAITGLLYGLEIGGLMFVFWGIPALFFRPNRHWDLLVRLFFFLMLEPIFPRLIYWTFGGLTFMDAPYIDQVADIVGASGLGFYSLGLNFLLLGAYRYFHQTTPISKEPLQKLFIGYGVLTLLGISYGILRTLQLEPEIAKGHVVAVASIQPNFSVADLASQPELAYSDREENIHELLEDSKKALSHIPKSFQGPKLVVWPESTYPYLYFKEPQWKWLVEQFAQAHQTHILLQSVDWSGAGRNRRYHGISVLIAPTGKVRGVYKKVFLFPFGEYIPLAKTFPEYGAWVRRLVPEISEFEPGKEFPTFQVSKEVQLAAPICFDAFSPEIMRNFVQNGASFGINLSNLAWYGKTSASLHMEMALRWNAIENRIPLIYASNNGQTVFLDALGDEASPKAPLFEQTHVTQFFKVGQHPSFFHLHREWVQWGWLGLWLVSGIGHFVTILIRRIL